ncbi:MAG: competence protein CoiA family protein [Verrucomicrobiota bacterium]
MAGKTDIGNTTHNDVEEIGCDGLIGGVAVQTKSNRIVRANEVTSQDGPFHCMECLTDCVVRKCTEKIDHFAHKARLSPVIGRGETDLHRNCKEEIRDGLLQLFPSGNWECERPIPENKDKKIPKLIPDISGRINGKPVVIEIQASYLTVPKIVKRSVAYRAKKCAVLWVVPLKEELGNKNFRPRLYERYLHSIYYGRVYYWMPGDGLLLRPVHYGIAHRYIEESEWYGSDAELHQAGGYDKPYKIIKKPEYGSRVHIASDFHWHDRKEFTPWNENKAVPSLFTWQDTVKVWWNVNEQKKFESRYSASSDD